MMLYGQYICQHQHEDTLRIRVYFVDANKVKFLTTKEGKH